MEAILGFLMSMTWVEPAIYAVGIMRLIAKPLMAFLKKFFKITPWDWDDKLGKKIEDSPFWSIFLWILDWLTSIKLKK